MTDFYRELVDLVRSATRYDRWMLRCTFWIVIGLVGCNEPRKVERNPIPPPLPVADDAEVLAERPPAIELPTAWPAMPPWERENLDLRHWEDLIGGYPRDVIDRLERITDLVGQLPKDDPRYVEARCVAGRESSFVRAQENFLDALAVLRARQPKPDEAYGSLLERQFATEVSWDWGDGKRFAVAAETLRMGADCDTPDIAVLEIERGDAFHRIGPRPKGVKPDLRKPKSTRKLSPRLAHIVALREEVEAVVGTKHPYAVAMEELVAKRCDEARERSRDPAACPTIDAAFARGLDVRLASLGEDHPATRDALLRVGARRLHAGKVAEAEALFLRAAAGPPIDRTRITAALLVAGIEVARGDRASAVERARIAAAASPTARHSDHVLVSHAWLIVAEIATVAGDKDLAARAREEAAQPRQMYGSLALAQRYDEKGKRRRALEHLNASVHAARLDVDAGPPERLGEARARLREVLRWRAAFHRWYGDDARSAEDVRAMLALK